VATEEEIDALAAEMARLRAEHGEMLPTEDIRRILSTQADALRGLILREYAAEVQSWARSSLQRVIESVGAQVAYHQATPDAEGDTWHQDAARSNAAKLGVLRAELTRRQV
jgi:hypothetical protein